MSKKSKIKLTDSAINIKPCIMCNPKKYLKFNFSFISHENGTIIPESILKLWERFKWLSEKTYQEMIFEYGKDKKRWFEPIPISEIRKEIPTKFREIFPTETNEHYEVLRVFPSGTPNGVANPRLIGMIKNTIFYIFYVDWEGILYKH